MANHENLSTPFIYLRSTGENISVTKEQRDAFYKEADRIRHKEQLHHRCMCSKKHLWECDGDCDIPTEDGEANMYDCIPNSSPSMENVIADRLLLDQLFNRLRELDPDADTIIQCWLDDYKISDRAIAEKLGRKQRTFADQMKKIRTELRKIRGY